MYCAVVPAPVTAIVPLAVKGLFATLKALGIDKPMEVIKVGKVVKFPAPFTY